MIADQVNRGERPSLYEAQKRHSEYYLLLLLEADQLFLSASVENRDGQALFTRELDNIRRGRDWAVRNFDRYEIAARIGHTYGTSPGNLLLHRLPVAECREWFDDALKIVVHYRQKEAEIDPRTLLGHLAMDQGDYKEAIYQYQELARIGVEANHLKAQALASGYIGLCFLEMGAIEQAIVELNEARQKLCSLGDHAQEAKVVGNLALAYGELRETQQAIELCKQAIKFWNNDGNRIEEASALGNLAMVYTKNKMFDEAISTCLHAANIFRALGYSHWEAQSLAQIGDDYSKSGDFKQSQTYLGKALTLYRVGFDRRGEARVLGMMGQAHLRAAQVDSAIGCFDAQIELARESGDSDSEINARGEKGEALVTVGDFAAGVEMLHTALSISAAKGNQAKVCANLCSLGNAYLKAGQIVEAKSFFEQEVLVAQRLKSPKHELHALNHLTELFEREGNTAEARNYLERILEVSKTSIDRHAEGSALRQYALFLARCGDFDSAIQRAESAQHIFETLRDGACFEKGQRMIEAFHQGKAVEMKEGVFTVIEPERA